MRYSLQCLLFLFIISSKILADEDSEEISSLEIALSADCEPLTTVAGCVNVESGRFFQVHNDFVGNTIDPIQLIRFYDSGGCMESFLGTGFGTQYPLIVSDAQYGSRHFYTMISARDGFNGAV